jgi:hypothetical protein
MLLGCREESATEPSGAAGKAQLRAAQITAPFSDFEVDAANRLRKLDQDEVQPWPH